MGARGPLPQSNVVQMRRGNPGKRPPKQTVRAKPGAPEPPTMLSREAKAEWKRIVPELDQLGILSKIDRAVLATYCAAWARFVELEKRLVADGTTVRDRDGKVRKHPAWQQWREAASLVTQLAKDIGVSPAARLRMTLPEAADHDEGAGILD